MSSSIIERLAAIIFSWPAIITALLLCISGVWLKRYGLVVAGALLSLPFDYYLLGSPWFRILAILIPVCLFASAYAVRRRIMGLAWLLLIPFAGIVLWIGTSIIWSR
jgi:hypothetical protein